jgi:hypothetical protein
VDWNEDGLKDLLAGEFGGKISYYRNIGLPGDPVLTFAGFLQAAGSPIDVGNNSCPWVDDWDEDGRKDLLTGAADGRIRLYLNEGTNSEPVFNPMQFLTLASGGILTVGSRSNPVVVDLNGDGLKDLVSGQVGGTPYYFENTGTNSAPLLANPDVLKSGSVGINPGATSRFAPLDWNRDGDIDLVAGSYEARLKLYLQTPVTPPQPVLDVIYTGSWLIPQSGGVLPFTIILGNPVGETIPCDVWSEARLPDGRYSSPLIIRDGITLAPFATQSRDLRQNLPASAPEGAYFYYLYAGRRERLQVYNFDEFNVYKANFTEGDLRQGGEPTPQAVAQRDDRTGAMLCAHPNPFNAEVRLQFAMNRAGDARLAVYDLRGREITVLMEGRREEGWYEVVFQGAEYPTGVYFARLTTSGGERFLKLMLVK